MSGDERPRLLERAEELAGIDAALARAKAGRGQLLYVEGPSGIGKTSLLAATSARARDGGFMVLLARCDELELAFPFGAAIQLLEPSVRGSGGAEELLGGAAALAAPLFATEAPADVAGEGDGAFARIHGLYWLCANLAERGPILISVDDAQWADDRSLEWLRYLARRLEGLPILLALAARAGEPGSMREPLARLASEPERTALRPSPLSEEAVGELIREGFGEAAATDLVRTCHEVSAGNPFFCHALIAELRARGLRPTAGAARRMVEVVPATIFENVAERLATLPSSARSVLRALAVLGETAELHDAAGLADLRDDEAALAVDALAKRGFTRPEMPPRFIHPIVRSSVYSAIPAGMRSVLHRRAAGLLASTGKPAEVIAAHLLEAEPEVSDWAVTALREAGRRACRHGDPVAGARYLERALDEPTASAGDRASLLLELGRAKVHAGDPGAVNILEEALRPDIGDARQLKVLRELGRALTVFGRLDDAAGIYDRACAAQSPDQSDQGLQMEAELASVAINASRGGGVAERLTSAADLRGESVGERMMLAVAAFAAAQANQPADRVSTLARRSLDAWWEGERPLSASLCFYEAVIALLYADSYDTAGRHLEEAVADARARGSLSGFGTAAWLRAWSHLRLGRLADAETEARGAEESMAGDGGSPGPLIRGILVETLVERGKLEEADEALGEEARRELPEVSVFNPLLYSRGRLLITSGRLEEGVADVLEAGRRETAVGGVTPNGLAWRSTAAVARAALGDIAAARPLAREEVHLARASGAPRALGIALRGLGVVEGGEAGIELLRESVASLEAAGAQLEAAHSLTELGSALRRSGMRKQARDPLRRALAIAEGCGAAALGERAREELVASGARPRRAALKGRDSLTPSELRVARMAAAEQANREIAQALFITVRTVEGHLSRAYAKLEISSRDGLAAALGERHPAAGHERRARREAHRPGTTTTAG